MLSRAKILTNKVRSLPVLYYAWQWFAVNQWSISLQRSIFLQIFPIHVGPIQIGIAAYIFQILRHYHWSLSHTPAFSTTVIWCHVFHSRVFSRPFKISASGMHACLSGAGRWSMKVSMFPVVQRCAKWRCCKISCWRDVTQMTQTALKKDH